MYAIYVYVVPSETCGCCSFMLLGKAGVLRSLHRRSISAHRCLSRLGKTSLWRLSSYTCSVFVAAVMPFHQMETHESKEQRENGAGSSVLHAHLEQKNKNRAWPESNQHPCRLGFGPRQISLRSRFDGRIRVQLSESATKASSEMLQYPTSWTTCP